MDASPPPPVPEDRLPRRRWLFLAGFLGWLLPGLGHLYAGRPVKAALHFLAISGLFVTGLALTGFTAVDPVKRTLEFVAHALMGIPTVVGLRLGEGVALDEIPRWAEVGRLFAAVAGLLNVVAVCDALGEVIAHNLRVEAARRAILPPPTEILPLSAEAANGEALAARDQRQEDRPSDTVERLVPPEPESAETAPDAPAEGGGLGRSEAAP